MTIYVDGPASPLFSAVKFKGNMPVSALGQAGVSNELVEAASRTPEGACVQWGIPYQAGDPIVATDEPVTASFEAVTAPWLVVVHNCDIVEENRNPKSGMTPLGVPMFLRGPVPMGTHMADYVLLYADGGEESTAIRRRFEIAPWTSRWGDSATGAVPQSKPAPLRGGAMDMVPSAMWGLVQTQAMGSDLTRLWLNWLWAWENPRPGEPMVGLRVEPKSGATFVWGLSAGRVEGLPLRWRSRRKAVLTLPSGEAFDPSLSDHGTEGSYIEPIIGGWRQIKMDMGQIISARSRLLYPNENWAETDFYQAPNLSENEVLVEYAAHDDANFHLSDGTRVPVRELEANRRRGNLRVVGTAEQKVRLRVLDKKTGRKVAVRLHLHGSSGEYLPPVDRHRQPNLAWFEDYSVDFSFLGRHHSCYVDGEADIKLPLGPVYIELTKGFEVRPVRQVLEVSPKTSEIEIELENVLDWRARGWVTADTHVHFLSPQTALLEGAAEGVNVVNVLASQWGELFTNVGDFDGKTTFGSREAGGDGEYLVRFGSENRQDIMGHISLLGYEGRIITPLCTAGTNEGAIGDPVEALLTEWAARCKAQGGTVVIPHFPLPRNENAAAIVSGNVDAVEINSLSPDPYDGISPYALADWYRYLNCGYFVAAVGGTDKMATTTAVGALRTYARINKDQEFTFQAWQAAVHAGDTFVSYGPLIDMNVAGERPGSRVKMSASGGTLTVDWQAASVMFPMTRADLVINGEVRESKSIDPWEARGSWTVKLNKSSWLAVLLRGNYRDRPEIIGAHTSPVMVEVDGSEFMAAADAMTILTQIEGALAYLDTVGTRAQTEEYKRMRMKLVGVHRTLHNRMHAAGVFHGHSAVTDHEEHH